MLQRKLYYGLIDYQAPATPRGSRSTRGRRACKKNIEESQMRAFELLATVAGKFLLEGEASIKSAVEPGVSQPATEKETVKQGHQDKQKPVKTEPCEQGSSDEAMLASKIQCQKLSPKIKFKELSRKSASVLRQHNLVAVKSETPQKSDSANLSAKLAGNVEDKSSTSSGDCGVHRDSISSVESPVTKVGNGIPSPLETVHETTGNNRSIADLFCSEDPMDLDSKSPTLVSSGSSVEVPSCGNFTLTDGHFANYNNETKYVDRDDDENSSRCTQPSTIYSKAYRPQHGEDRRIRKVLASKFWKSGPGPSLARGGALSRTGNQVKPSYHCRKMCYTHQRTHKSYFKRRKLFDRKSVFLSDAGIRRQTVVKSSGKHIKEEAGEDSRHKLEDYQVKFSIKSFKVPELYIEMPETATVGDLKRTVLETVNAILRNGLRVGVIFQGKKVRDDNKTLFQAGLSKEGKPDGLGFCLEPSTQATPQLARPESGPTEFLDQGDSYKPISWLPASESGISVAAPDPSSPSVTTTSNNIENHLKLVASSSDNTISDDPSPDSKALVPVSAVESEALAVVPIQRKSSRSETVQRRIRRPFSVAEVEALVQAVEILGTGRWRDVKVRAFENASHRTYVDLKDKWKTLVHTARISPHQRRGEPVPQELLDRVLSAHAYWSQQQAKLQVKQQQQQPPPPVATLPAQALQL